MLEMDGFRISEEIYKNESSKIFRANRVDDNKKVIIKFLNSKTPTQNQILKFKREFNLTKKIESDKIIKTYDFIQTDSNYAIIYEDFGGESLDRVLKNTKPLNLEKFLNLSILICDCLGDLHANNIIHKDINPSNIVWNVESDIVKIIDLGISTELSREKMEISNPNIMEGTLAYISPEQTGRMNIKLDYRTDFYSLGVSLFELFTGNLPFTSEDAMTLIHCHIARKIENPYSLCAIEYSSEQENIIRTLSDIISKLMDKSVEKRYQSTIGIKNDLKECLNLLKNCNYNKKIELGKKDLSLNFQIPQKLYGRVHELEILENSFNGVIKGKKELLLISGEPGVGKSALVYEINKSVTSNYGYFIQGKFDQFKKNIPYSAFIVALSQLIKNILTENEEKLTKWKVKILNVLGNNGQIVIDLIPELELLIGKQPELPKLGLDETRNRFNTTFQNFLKSIGDIEQPIVIFLDDLQWADSASLKLIELTMTDMEIKGLMLIGAYRDNEISEAHPLSETIKKIENEYIRYENLGIKLNSEIIRYISIKPLKIEDVVSLAAETLLQKPEDVLEFAKAIHKRTEGNPFFVNQLVSSLYVDEIINLDSEKASWTWDNSKLNKYSFSSNVVELMISKINSLAEDSIKTLNFAACIGNSFDLNTLSQITEQSANEVSKSLFKPLRLGLIEPEDYNYKYINYDTKSSEGNLNPKYSFIHDRVQQASYQMLDELEKKKIHLSIAKFMLKKLNISDNFMSYQKEKLTGIKQELVFDITNHLNSAKELLKKDNELNFIKQVNLTAGEKALAANAYIPALEYFNTGINMTNAVDWEKNYNLTKNLYINTIVAQYYNFEHEQVMKTSNFALKHIKSAVDKVDIIEIIMKSLYAREKTIDVLDTGINILKELGINIPSNPNTINILLEFLKTKSVIKGKSLDALYKLPIMEDEKSLAICRILTAMVSSAYVSKANLSPILSLKLVQLSVKYGNYPNAQIYPFFGLMNLAITKNLDACYNYGELGLRISNKKGYEESKIQNLMMFYTFNYHWKKPLVSSIDKLLDGYQVGIEYGDFEYACWCLHIGNYTDFYTGTNLNELTKKMQLHREKMIKLQQNTIFNIFINIQQMVSNLMGECEDPTKLNGKYMNEDELLAKLEGSSLNTTLGSTYFCKVPLAYIFGKYQEAVDFHIKYESYTDSVGLSSVPFVMLFHSLARLALCYNSDSKLRKKMLNSVIKDQKSMKKWSDNSPESHKYKWTLVEAEVRSVKGNFIDALNLYEKAIQLAKDTKNIFELSLAYELLGRFYIRQGNEELSSLFIKKSYTGYINWGATGKAALIEKEFPKVNDLSEKNNIMHSTLNTTVGTSTIGGSSTAILDLMSNMKALQTISGEVGLDNLLSQIMQLIIENAGAENGCLLLPKDDSWFIKTMGEVEKGFISISDNLNIDIKERNDKTCISKTILQYVVRTKDTVLLDDAMKSDIFANDECLKKENAKSLICMPLINQKKLIGILYLKNNLVTGAFTEDRIQVLKMISSQAAVSIENTKLYVDLAQSENKFRGIFENAGVGIFQTSLSGEIITANPALVSMLKYESLDDMIKQVNNFKDNVYIDQAKRVELINILSEQGHVRNFECEYLCKDNSSITASLNAMLIKDKHNNIEYIEGVIEDITKKKLADKYKIEKEVAEAATKAKSEFLANMSHEIRTPMNAVIGLSELTLRSELTSKQEDYLFKINRSAKDLLTIINGILDYSKMEAGKIILETIEFNFDDVIENLKTIVGLRAYEKGINFIFDISNEIPNKLLGDPIRLGQILINLANNAVKFTDRGEVLIKAVLAENTSNEAKIKFTVKDTGIGMSKDQITKLFKSFHQADSSTTRKYGGTGLGLAISKQLVTLMNGEIRCESEVGKGSQFYFDISLEFKSEKDKNLDQNIKEILSKKVLIIDENTTQSNILKTILNSYSIDSSVLTNIEELEKFNESFLEDYSLIILGYGLNSLNFDKILNIIKSNKYLVQLKKICTVPIYGREKFLENYSYLDFEDILEKPFLHKSFINSIKRVFGNDDSTIIKVKKEAIPYFVSETKGKKANVLLVDDNKINLEVSGEFLEQMGINVDYALNGIEAIKSILNNDYNLVFMDIHMPEMDGIDATKLIRKEHNLDIPIIAMSANTLTESMEQCMSIGMNDYITKPVDPDMLVSKLIQWLYGYNLIEKSQQKQHVVKNDNIRMYLTNIAGLDYNQGLRLTGNSVSNYHSLLKKFVTTKFDSISIIRDYLKKGKYKQAELEAHSIRGVAGVLGFSEISDISAKLERAIRENQNSDINSIFSNLESISKKSFEHLKSQLDNIPVEAIVKEKHKSFDMTEFIEKIEILANYLNDGNSKSNKLSEELEQMTENEKLKDYFKQIREYIDDVEYEEALKVINTIKIDMGDEYGGEKVSNTSS